MASNPNEQLKGSFYIILSSFFFGTQGIWARLIGSSMDNFYQAWTRSLLIIAILIPIAVITKQFKKIARKDIKWIVYYCFAGIFAIAPIFYAFNTLGIGPATLIYYASITIATYVIGFISFNEKITPVKFISLFLALTGLFLIFNLSLSSGLILGAIAAVVAGAIGGSEVAYTKKVSKTYSPMLLSIFYWGTVFVAYIIFSLVFKEKWLTFSFSVPWLGVFIYAISSILANLFVIIGFKFIEPSVGGIIGLLEIIFGIIFGIIFFHEVLTTSMIIGGLLILITAALPNLKDLLYSRRN